RDRVEALVLARRERRVRPVNRGAGGEDDTADVLVAPREQDVQRPVDVDGVRGERVLNRAGDGAERPEVVDELGAAHGVVHALVAAQLALDDLDVELVEVRPETGREVVEDADVVATSDESA